jgi:predicted nucleic acid-binding protein
MIRIDNPGRAALVATDVCVDLALGDPEAAKFFRNPPVELRLATATYLELLQAARTEEERQRVRRFAQGFPVLSLGPVASSTAVELLVRHGGESGIQALQALVAATALAHEIPLITRRRETYAPIAGLELIAPY